MSLHHAIPLFCAAFVGGLLNSVAGGGGFVCFPTLLFTGVPPINANATNTVALWPGTVASVAAYRRSLLEARSMILPLTLTGMAGAPPGGLIPPQKPQAAVLQKGSWVLLVWAFLFAFLGESSGGVCAPHPPGQQHAPPGAG